jgi:hypothetical protein
MSLRRGGVYLGKSKKAVPKQHQDGYQRNHGKTKVPSRARYVLIGRPASASLPNPVGLFNASL